ncbi:class I SAM-dependent methyltransferase [Paracnuella aquatica]|uniref:class I SAM-dependent methyltransferase n=1 Tax=Paracnuella aquatica TaxID=2268757 RepID=UPI00139058B7|nr:class I SAM-dependent methyltransferase [Paracnuella aquatica]
MSYIFNIIRTGAVRTTPKNVIQQIAKNISANQAPIVIELGAGKGEITAAVINSLQSKEEFQYYAFEISKPQCNNLKNIHNRIKPICEDALKFRSFIPTNTKVDTIISSLPLSFLPKADVDQMLVDAKNCLMPGGKIVIVFTAPWLAFQLKRFLPNCTISTFLSFPPYLLLTYEKPSVS